MDTGPDTRSFVKCMSVVTEQRTNRENETDGVVKSAVGGVIESTGARSVVIGDAESHDEGENETNAADNTIRRINDISPSAISVRLSSTTELRR